ncbi:malate dehydrogenase [candidate division WOR-3 bacterium RBG_13_43_14]|uniref:Malate dehydrogenase n=1 Tax=candidate division WOR-3 bacterium RBG_13_43_14 TaxID=1802590 RepID=A0A1F4UG78_UNCW3|nr:MAG: malate dehydrogenase [candidate division WOR-3 bacterium RBG_13_43_14]
MKKVSIIGAGNVGANAAFYIGEKNFADVMMIDSVEGRAKGKALDLMEAAPARVYEAKIDGSDNIEDIAGSEVVVITAGHVRKPHMSRLDLLESNAKLIDPIIGQIKKYTPDAIIINITEPVDALTWYILKKGSFDPKKVIGMTGVLDTTRLREFISKELQVSTANTTAIVIGGHHDYMVIIPRYATVEGIPITQLLPKEKIDALIKRTREAGSEILSYLKTATAHYAPAAAIAEIVEAIVKDSKRVLCVSTCLLDEYDIKDLCLGVPVIIGAKGVEKVIKLLLTLEEKQQFDESVAVIRSAVETLEL